MLKKIGYMRDGNISDKISQLMELGVPKESILTGEVRSRKTTGQLSVDWPVLSHALEDLRPGDVLQVASVEDLASKSVDELVTVLCQAGQRNVKVYIGAAAVDYAIPDPTAGKLLELMPEARAAIGRKITARGRQKQLKAKGHLGPEPYFKKMRRLQPDLYLALWEIWCQHSTIASAVAQMEMAIAEAGYERRKSPGDHNAVTQHFGSKKAAEKILRADAAIALADEKREQQER